MTHLLRLEKNGSYVDLNANAIRTLRYVPVSPEISSVDAISTIEDGGERYLTTRRNVSETVSLLLRPYPTSVADVEASVQTIELWLKLAEEHQTSGAGSPVFLEFQPSGSTGIWRTEILSGKLDLDEDAMSWWASGKKVKGSLSFTRRYYFEGPEAEIRLTNSSGSNVTGGIGIFNHEDADAGHDNYVELNASDIKGSQPTKPRIEITNSYDSATRDNTFFIGLNNFASMDIKHVLEGENSATLNGSTVGTNTSYSGGSARTFNLTTSMGILGAWALDSTMLGQYRGRYYKVIARVTGPIPAGTILKLVIKFPSGSYLTTVAETQEIKLSTTQTLQEIASIQLPPWLTQETSLYPVDLCLFGYNQNGSGSITIDNLFLMPLDGYRVLIPKGYGLGYQARIVDDGISNALWTDGWDTPGKTGHYIGFGDQLEIWPATTSRIYFAITTPSGGAEILRTHTVRVFYRPRRLTV